MLKQTALRLANKLIGTPEAVAASDARQADRVAFALDMVALRHSAQADALAAIANANCYEAARLRDVLGTPVQYDGEGVMNPFEEARMGSRLAEMGKQGWNEAAEAARATLREARKTDPALDRDLRLASTFIMAADCARTLRHPRIAIQAALEYLSTPDLQPRR